MTHPPFTSSPRIGYACKFKPTSQQILDAGAQAPIVKTLEENFNFKTTTAKHLNTLTKKEQEEKLCALVTHNINALFHQIGYISGLPLTRRMLRIGSDLLPFYTHPDFKWIYTTNLTMYVESLLFELGSIARKKNIRLSMHPGQFCVLASDRNDVLQNSIEEFEYHASIIRAMGYGTTFQDFKCNVHVSGKKGLEGMLYAYSRLTDVARNSITIENDEYSCGVDEIIQIADTIPIVLDVHHHWIHSGGEYIQPDDDRFKRIQDSWRGVRPVVHYSISREDMLVNHDPLVQPDFRQLLTESHKKGKLRAHSDGCWNQAMNDYILQFWPHADIMVEAKNKNLAADELHEHAKKHNSYAFMLVESS